jgi:hypothetical protein
MKNLLATASLVLLFLSCQNEPSENSTIQDQQANVEKNHKRSCETHEAYLRELKENPSFAKRRSEIQNFIQKSISSGNTDKADKIINIPVIYNVIYSNESENISLSQLQSQIDVLNKDFNAKNTDFNNDTPYASVKANVGITFTISKVNRLFNAQKSWAPDDRMKFPRRGGIAVTDPTKFLNIWVVNQLVNNKGRVTFGFATFPGGRAATDGVVIGSKYFGNIGNLEPEFNLGRTGTHEVGHWLNLEHIFGFGSSCATDLVDDTPAHDAPNYDIPPAGHRSKCTGTPLEMFMNYMDYVDDKVMFMFSNGQKDVMRATFAPGGGRETFAK